MCEISICFCIHIFSSMFILRRKQINGKGISCRPYIPVLNSVKLIYAHMYHIPYLFEGYLIGTSSNAVLNTLILLLSLRRGVCVYTKGVLHGYTVTRLSYHISYRDPMGYIYASWVHSRHAHAGQKESQIIMTSTESTKAKAAKTIELPLTSFCTHQAAVHAR